MFKKVMVSMCAFVILVGGVFSVSFDSEASASVKFNVDYAEPSQSDSQGFMNVLLYTGSGYQVQTYFWSCYGVKDGVQSPAEMHINFTSSTSIEFVPYVKGADGVFYSLGMIDGSNSLYYELFSSDSARYTRNTGYEIRGYTIHGNGYVDSYDLGQVSFVVNFSSGQEESLLQDIIDELLASNDYGRLIYENVFNILNSVDGVEAQLTSIASYLRQIGIDTQGTNSRLDILLSQVNKGNTWLEKIFNYLEESQEQQKQEATNQGNSSVSQGESAIEDKGAAFGDGITALTSSMSYTGTDCAWQFPQLKLPAISGVMDEVVLVESQPINFSQWVNAIPSDILLLIRSVLTIGLIVYCFKELYSTIAYVLTLRKDDNS